MSEKAFGANPGDSGEISVGLAAMLVDVIGDLPWTGDEGKGPVSILGFCGEGDGMFLPGILAVGGGAIPVL